MTVICKLLPPSCKGELCRICKSQAYHKVEEVDFGAAIRHPFTAYICCLCFCTLFGEWTHDNNKRNS